MDFNVVDGYVKAGFWIDYKNLKFNLTKSGDYLGAVGVRAREDIRKLV